LWGELILLLCNDNGIPLRQWRVRGGRESFALFLSLSLTAQRFISVKLFLLLPLIVVVAVLYCPMKGGGDEFLQKKKVRS
jgi:hypothetical protein